MALRGYVTVFHTPEEVLSKLDPGLFLEDENPS
jgi:hypothetical protein